MFQDPGAMFQDAGTLFQDPGTMFQDPGTMFQDPGTIFQDPGTCSGRAGCAGCSGRSAHVRDPPEQRSGPRQECGERVNPTIGSRTDFWHQIFTIGVNMGRYGLILSGFYMMTQVYSAESHACDPTTPKAPKPSK